MNVPEIGNVLGLPEAERRLLNTLLDVWGRKLARNTEKIRYYEMKNRVQDLGIAIPEPLRHLDLVVGWPAKAVDCLAIRSRFDGFTFPDNEDHGLKEVLDDNQFKLLYRQAATDELVNSCSFLTVSKGGVHEPDVVLHAYSAVDAAGLWDRRAKRIRAGVVVVDVEEEGGFEPQPTWVNLYTETDVWEIRRGRHSWTSRRNPHKMGRPLIEPLVYKADTTHRPFGRSRISRAVMRITDAALRANLREEVSAEFAAAAQKYILGADEGFFDDNDKVEAYIGSFQAFPVNELGDVPHVGQFPQTTTLPQIESIRMLAGRFAGETSIPVTELGIIHDNPASYEALVTMYSSLITECEDFNERNGEALKAVGKMVLATLGEKPFWALDKAEKSIMCEWEDPSLMNSNARMDRVAKEVAVWPWMAESPVSLARAGIKEDQRVKLMADKELYEQKQLEMAQQIQQGQAQQEPIQEQEAPEDGR